MNSIERDIKPNLDHLGYDILDRGFVWCRGHLGSDLDIVNDAKISHDRLSTTFGDDEHRLLRFLSKEHHTAPFRHQIVKLNMKATEAVMRQIYKHTIGAGFTDQPWSEVSGRYIPYTEVHQPTEWRSQPEKAKQGSGEPLEDQHSPAVLYADAVQNSVDTYNRLLALGVCREQARFIMPFATYTHVHWTASLQTLLHFIRLRDDDHAQYEVRLYAVCIRNILMELFPETMAAVEDVGNHF